MPVLPIDYTEEMQQSYLDYAMSVIFGRALPDVRDGFKPVHRRILYAMYTQKILPDTPFKKSAKVVGEVLGKFHPHGDSAVYEAMVRIAQDFSLRYPLIDGQGNMGSMDGDSAAAMRYTEVRLAPLALEMVRGIEKDTVKFIPNYDEEETEPLVLPSRFPNLLVNGVYGIAVAMSTSIPSHNLKEVIQACNYLIDNPKATNKDLLKFIKGPDFPTGGEVVKDNKFMEVYETGSGTIKIRGKAQAVKEKGRTLIEITEIPYTFNNRKTKLIENIGEAHNKKKLDNIIDVRDESSKDGLRIVIELKRGADPEKTINQLYAYTKLTDTFNCSFLALVNGKPQTLSLKDLLVHYIDHQKEIVTREATYDLNKAKERKEKAEGLVKAADVLDEIIACIRASNNHMEAKKILMGKGDLDKINVPAKVKKVAQKAFDFTEAQAQAILDLKLVSLTRLEVNKFLNELKELNTEINRLEKLLNSQVEVLNYIKKDLEEIAKKYGDKRRTSIISSVKATVVVAPPEVDDSPGYLVVDNNSYVKWIGQRSLGENQEDISFISPVTRLGYVLLIDSNGMVWKTTADKFPEAKWNQKGKPINTLNKLEDIIWVDTWQNQKEDNTDQPLTLFAEEEGEKPLIQFSSTTNLLMITQEGMVKKSPALEYTGLARASNGIKLKNDDKLVEIVKVEDNNNYIALVTELGYCLKVPIKDIPVTARSSSGVRGVKMMAGDKVSKAFMVSNKDTLTIETRIGTMEIAVQKIPSKRDSKGVLLSKEKIINIGKKT